MFLLNTVAPGPSAPPGEVLPAEAAEEEAAAQAEELIEASHDKLFDTVEGMDKSVLVELSTALGGLVQSMFIDRETTKQRMQAEERQRRQAADEAVARANLDKRATEQILAGNFNQLESSSILPEVLTTVYMMSRPWCEAQGVLAPSDARSAGAGGRHGRNRSGQPGRQGGGDG